MIPVDTEKFHTLSRVCDFDVEEEFQKLVNKLSLVDVRKLVRWAEWNRYRRQLYDLEVIRRKPTQKGIIAALDAEIAHCKRCVQPE